MKVNFKVVGLLVLLGIVIPGSFLIFYGSEEEINVTVKEKWVKNYSDSSIYLFSDTDGNVYEITDSLFLWKWEASNRYAFIEINKTYQITTYGWRIPFLSSYPNAIYIEEV